jgi:hypothetical protein
MHGVPLGWMGNRFKCLPERATLRALTRGTGSKDRRVRGHERERGRKLGMQLNR